jgi:hypothetical protein
MPGDCVFAREVQHSVAGDPSLSGDDRGSALEDRQIAVLEELRGDGVDNQADLVQLVKRAFR